MLRFTRIFEAEPDESQRAAARVLRLTADERAKSRHAAMFDDGTVAAIILPRGTVLRDGAWLVAETGELARIEAALQPVARVTASSPLHLLRAVYHLANRHVPAQISADAVLIERDAVLERMLANLGASIEHVELRFEPEAGAYDGEHHHAHAVQIDEASRNLGEELSIAAHRARAGGEPPR
jgi:urease accessory protein